VVAHREGTVDGCQPPLSNLSDRLCSNTQAFLGQLS
jgi:hypothetical protein